MTVLFFRRRCRHIHIIVLLTLMRAIYIGYVSLFESLWVNNKFYYAALFVVYEADDENALVSPYTE